MAAIHIVQLAHLSQDLIEHIIQAHNQLARAKYELDRIQQTTKLYQVPELVDQIIGRT